VQIVRTIGRGTAGLVLLVLAACGSSGGSPGDTASVPATASGSSLASPAPATASSAGGTPADVPTTAAINRAYATFFGSSSTAAQSQAALQHGALFAAALRAQGSSSYADRSSASVDSARLTAPDVAAVSFTIRSGGSVLLDRVPGLAVRTDGRWQVAAKTFCDLVTLEGDAPAACKDPAAIALPH
jgi:hypothetical protein